MQLSVRILRKVVRPPGCSFKYVVRSPFSTVGVVSHLNGGGITPEPALHTDEEQQHHAAPVVRSASEADPVTQGISSELPRHAPPAGAYSPTDTVKVCYNSTKKKLAQVVPVDKHARGPEYTYTGEWQDGFPHGHGRLSSSDETHIGQFQQGRRCGHSMKLHADGFFYNGTYLNNQPSGFGLLYTAVSTYRGEFLGGLRDGWGSFELAVGPKVMDGEGWSGQGYSRKQQLKLREKVKSLVAKATSKEPDSDSSEPVGLEAFTAGDVLDEHQRRQARRFTRCHRYDGEWSHGERHGLGTLRWNSGASYTGYWEDGHCTGRGTYVSCAGAIFDGTWKQDQLSAQHPCVISLPCGTQYMGRLEVREPLPKWLPQINPVDLIQGTGSIHYANGNVYRGDILNGKKHGRGILVDSNDVILREGEWENDRGAKMAVPVPGAAPEERSAPAANEKLRP